MEPTMRRMPSRAGVPAAEHRAVLIWVTVAGLAAGIGLGASAGEQRPEWRPQGAKGVTVEVVAGGDDGWGDGGPATEAVLAGVGGLAVDRRGNLYISDASRNRIRRVDAETGVIETLAGTGLIHGTAGSKLARETVLRAPGPLVLGPQERFLYTAEIVGRRVRRIDLQSGRIEDLGGPEGGFQSPAGLVWSPSGLVVADGLRGLLWQRGDEGWKSLLPAGAHMPGGIRAPVLDAEGDLYLAEYFSHRILRWDHRSGSFDIAVGTGEPGRSDKALATEAKIRTPAGLAFDPQGNLYISDNGNHRICRVDRKTGRLRAVYQAGAHGTGAYWTPGPLTLDARGRLWVGDIHYNRILRFTPGTPEPEIVAGGGSIGDGGPAREARISHPGSVAADGRGNVYISDALQHRIRKVDFRTGKISTVAGMGFPGYNGDVIPAHRAMLSSPAGIAVAGDRMYVSDYYNDRVRLVDLAGGSIVTIAGNGSPGESGDGTPAPLAEILNPHAIFLDGDSSLYIASAVSSKLRRIDLKNGTIHSVPLDESVSPNLVFFSITRWRGDLVLATSRPSGIHRLTEDGKLTTLFERPQVYFPQSVAVSPEGDLFICDTGNDRILRWDGVNLETVVEGLGRPRAMSFAPGGDLLVADTFHNRVLRVRLPHPPAANDGALRVARVTGRP